VRRLRVRRAPRKRPALGRSRHAHDLLGAFVVGLEVAVADRPIIADSVRGLQPEVIRHEARRASDPAVRSAAEAESEGPLLVGQPSPPERLLRVDAGRAALLQLPVADFAEAALEDEDVRRRGRVAEILEQKE
jgi:hypothetical protein